jgi:hypothetical protein
MSHHGQEEPQVVPGRLGYGVGRHDRISSHLRRKKRGGAEDRWQRSAAV